VAAPRGSLLHQQAVTVAGIFTGLTLTSLVLILNSPGAFHTPLGPITGEEYFEFVITYIAIVSAMSSVATVAYLEIAGGISEIYSFLDSLGTALFLTSVFSFMGILPLILAPFTHIGAAVVLAFEVVLLTVYFVGRRLPPRARFRGPNAPNRPR
jgi:hypothetical protein